MLNPSTADAERDDPTIRRCMGFARGWGFGGVVVVNLFGLRSPDPAALLAAADPVGPLNDAHVRRACRDAGLVVAAWGAHRSVGKRALEIGPLLGEACCFGRTLGGDPRHPLYLRRDAPLRFSDTYRDCLYRNYSPLVYDEPFYYGHFRNMTLLYLFDLDERLRLTHSPSGGGFNKGRNSSNPAWDFQFIIPDYDVDHQYDFRGRLVYRPTMSRAEVLAEVEKFRKLA